MMIIGAWILLLLAGGATTNYDAHPNAYDYSASNDCLPEPLAPQYNGGITTNPTFDQDLVGWTVYDGGQIGLETSSSGNKYVVSYNRTEHFHGVAQVFTVKKDTMYILSAWVRMQTGNDFVLAAANIPQEIIQVGNAVAKSDCWSLLKGGFQVDRDMDVQLFFKSHSTLADIWIDNVSLKPFSMEQWRRHQREAIKKFRMKKINIHVTDSTGKAIEGVQISLNETRPDFHIGCGTTEYILSDKGYQDWFTARFSAVTFDNEMKWYDTDRYHQGENYTIPDAMVAFFEQHGIAIRGHNILWDVAQGTPLWVNKSLPLEVTPPHMAILNASVNHLNSVVSRYKGKVIGWDVINENMHYNFYDAHISPNASAMFFQIAHALDPETPLFLNEYSVLSSPGDLAVNPAPYVERIKMIRSFPGNENLTIGIGEQGHFAHRPNLPFIRAGLDVLGSTNMPIWITELDTRRGPNQAAWLEDVMREAFSHPAVKGIIVWSGWKPSGCSETCLADMNYTRLLPGCSILCLMDDNYKNTHAGNVVDNLMRNWRASNVNGMTDMSGNFIRRLFKGEYTLSVSHPQFPSTFKQEINVTGEFPEMLELNVSLR